MAAFCASTVLGSDRVELERVEDVVLARESLARAGAPDAIPIEIDRSVRNRILDAGRARIRDFPLPSRAPVELELTAFNLLAPGARLVIVDEDGERDVPAPAFRAFRGQVDGDPDSLVSLSFFGDRVAGFIRTWDAEYAIGPEQFNPAAADRTALWVRKRPDPEGRPEFECDGAIPAGVGPLVGQVGQTTRSPVKRGFGRTLGLRVTNEDSGSTTAIDENTLLRATIAIDATVEWYQHFGSLAAAQNYILNVMAQVSTIYENEVKVQVDVGYLRVFTAEPDPYTDGSENTSVLLEDMRSEWISKQAGISRTSAHLFSVRNNGGSGLAYVNVLCSNNSGYGVSTMTANGGAWEKDLVAHELGHNFSSPHTHCYVPEIDRCANQNGCYEGPTEATTGTIMSYCSQIQSVFHQRVKDEKIRPAAEAAYPTCIQTAGLPGAIQGNSGAGLLLRKAPTCPTAGLQNDDDQLDSYLGYGGTLQMAWIKRFTPSCYPFRLTTAEVLIGHPTVAPGRPIRVLVYTDPAGTGNPVNATLVHSQDTTVQVVSAVSYNQYTLSDPVVISSGDYYVGFYDLVADAADNFIATTDTSREGDAFRTANSTSPDSFSLHSGATWMIRASGGAVEAGSLLLEWDAPCNDAGTPGQDYAVYNGAIGSFSGTTPLTCSTSRATSYLASGVANGSFFLVVPSTVAAEGSYGLDSDGTERPASAQACMAQEIGSCP